MGARMAYEEASRNQPTCARDDPDGPRLHVDGDQPFLGDFSDHVLRSFRPMTAGLNPGVRHSVRSRTRSLIDVNRAEAESCCRLHRLIDVASENASPEPIRLIVRPPDGFFNRLEGDYADHRGEDLLINYLHSGFDIGHDGRLQHGT